MPLGDPIHLGVARVGLPQVALAQDNLVVARVWLDQSLATWREHGVPHMIVLVLQEFAALAAAQGDAARALRLASAAEAVLEKRGLPRPPMWQAFLQRWLAPARQALSEAEQAAAWAAGHAMSVEQAIREAQEMPAPGAGAQ